LVESLLRARPFKKGRKRTLFCKAKTQHAVRVDKKRWFDRNPRKHRKRETKGSRKKAHAFQEMPDKQELSKQGRARSSVGTKI